MDLPAHLTLTDEAPVTVDTPAYGACREALLDAVALNRPGCLPAATAEQLQAWLQQMLVGEGQLLGLDVAETPADMLPVLRFSGAPLGCSGPLRWGTDCSIDDARGPLIEGDHLLLPSAERLGHMTSLALKPVRRFFAQRLGVRLQAATGIGLWLWPDRALVISQVAVPVAGFLHGPQPGRRCTLALEPGGYQLVSLV
jgi:hypothetical protein